jgi:heme-binding protein
VRHERFDISMCRGHLGHRRCDRRVFTHPDLNDFMSSLKGMTRSQVAAKVKGYTASHPDENGDMTGIRQPLQDLKNRCGAPPSP